MKSVRLIIPDLFLPMDFAAEVVAGLSLPALQKMLGRGRSEILEAVSLENILCESFGVPCAEDAPFAPISAAFDGLAAGCWLRADPVHLNLQRDQLLLDSVPVSSEEAALLCASLNEHFAGRGMEFFAPHPQRWYVRQAMLPRISTTPISQVTGGDVRKLLPTGEDAAHWHQVFNEIQMMLHAHPLNEAREARGEIPVNSVWFWGGGCDSANGSLRSSGEPAGLPLAGALLTKSADCGNSRQAAPAAIEDSVANRGSGCGKSASLKKNYDQVNSDEVLAEMLAAAANIPFSAWTGKWRDTEIDGMQLLVWTGLRSALHGGDLATWRDSLQEFESGYALPLWQALRSGKIDRLQMDALAIDGIRRVRLTRGDTWAFWRRSKRLAEFSMV